MNTKSHKVCVGTRNIDYSTQRQALEQRARKLGMSQTKIELLSDSELADSVCKRECHEMPQDK
ncbi:conserved hypothetical protein [Vibrio phage 249E41-1]|nr:conserved hypothetical protein [Vibrio phage 249E41-1]